MSRAGRAGQTNEQVGQLGSCSLMLRSDSVIDLTTLSDSDAESVVSEHPSEASDGSEIEITLNAQTRAQLQAAIATISEARLRRLLSRLVETDVTVEAALSRELLALPRQSQNVVPRWEMCANCNEDYDINLIQSTSSCVFHPGELDVCHEAFVDWDEDCHGPMDSTLNRTQYPENFLWSCCERDGTTDGCVRGKHRPAVPTKRRRIES